MTSDLQRDIERIDAIFEAYGLRLNAEAWQRIRQRLTPDREEMGWAIHDAVNRLGSDPISIEAALIAADAAIAAMGEP
ncbi:hypothetical protein [Pseudomonas sp.]|uniref:hypothetical protein n=1 Tax=Pseudomonas sp. TaxID=306 RepID=UPI00333F1C7D